MQASINAHIRKVEFKPHADMFRTQQSNYRVGFRFTKNENGNINMHFEFLNNSSHLNRVVNFSKLDMTTQEFDKFISKRDTAGKAIVSEFKKDNICTLVINGTLSAHWQKFPKDATMWVKKLDEIVKETRELNPNGPSVSFTMTSASILGANGGTGHSAFPSVIRLVRHSGAYTDNFPVSAGSPQSSKDLYRIEIEYHDPEHEPQNKAKFLFNAHTGAPSLCRFDYYGRTVDNLLNLLYTYNSKKIIDFFSNLQSRTTVAVAEYWYDGKFIPPEMLQELRFPLDECQEFDLMMRLE